MIYGGRGGRDVPSYKGNWELLRKVKTSKLRMKRGTDCLTPVREVLFKRNFDKKRIESQEIGPSIFGLPLMYQRVSEKPTETGRDTATITNRTGRKASPVSVTLHKLGNTHYRIFLLVIPSQISDERSKDDRPLLMISGNRNTSQIFGNEDFDALKTLLEEEMARMPQMGGRS